MIPQSIFAYYVSAEAHTPESVEQQLLNTAIDRCWFSVRGMSLEGAPHPWMMIELTDLQDGEPLNVPQFGELLSDEGGLAIAIAAPDPELSSAAFAVFRAGETVFSWAGAPQEFAAELPDGAAFQGDQGFFDAFAHLSGLSWPALLAASASARAEAEREHEHVCGHDHEHGEACDHDHDHGHAHDHEHSEAGDHDHDHDHGEACDHEHGEAGDHGHEHGEACDHDHDHDHDHDDDDIEHADGDTALVLRGRVLALPIGTPRREELFRFHYAGGEQSEAVGDQLALVLLDPQLSHFLWTEAPAQQVAAFLEAVEAVGESVLGPLAHALTHARAYITRQDPEKPLAEAEEVDDVTHELLCMATAVTYLTGDSISYYDECFFPLLALGNGPVAPQALRDSLEEIEALDVLTAMTEVLPYSVPEGELLESFADDEMAPPFGWEPVDGVYDGSLFLLDGQRLAQRVAGFDPEAFSGRVSAFFQTWNEVLESDGRPRREPHERDGLALGRFVDRLNELQLLLALGEVNQLQPAVFFYGG